MKKPTITLIASLVSALFVASPVAQAQTSISTKRPNIVILLGDDLGYADLGA